MNWLFFKTLPQKGLVEKEIKEEMEKKLKAIHRRIAAANGSSVCDPIVAWTSKKPHCFKKIKNIYRLHKVHHFARAKAWMKQCKKS